MSFEQLPVDLLAEILHFEDVPTLNRLCQVNSTMRTLCNNESLWKKKFVELTQIQDPTDHSIPNTLARTWLDRVRLFWGLTHPKTVVTMIFFGSTIKNYITDSIETAKTCVTQNYNQGSMIFEPHLYVSNSFTRMKGSVDMNEIQFLITLSKFYKTPFFNLTPSNTSLTLLNTQLHPQSPIFTIPGNDRNLMYELMFVFYKYSSIATALKDYPDSGIVQIMSFLLALKIEAEIKDFDLKTLTVKDIEIVFDNLKEDYKIVEMPIAQCPYAPGQENIGLVVSPIQLQRESFPTFKPALSPEFVASRVRVPSMVRVPSSPRQRSGRKLPPPPLIRPVFPPPPLFRPVLPQPSPRLFQLQRFLPNVPQLDLPPLPTQPPIRFRK